AWRHDPPEVTLRLRRQHLRPHLEAFFAWAQAEFEQVRSQRGLVRSAFGYATRQKDALMRVLDDGRLILENNRSERAIRRHRSDERTGSSSAAMRTARAPATSSRWSRRHDCIGLTLKRICAISSACWRTGRASAISSWRPSIGPLPALASTPPSWLSRSALS